MAGIRVVPISEARARLTELVEEVGESHEPCYIASRSKVKAVLVAKEDYDKLMERAEKVGNGRDSLAPSIESQRPRSEDEQKRIQEAIAELMEFSRGRTLGDLTVKDLIEEGRRY